jgi:hypothetical protein
MKLLTLTFLFCTACFISRSQPKNIYNLPLDSATGKISFDSVFIVADVNKDAIYAKSKEWIATFYKSARDVINMDDKESGLIKLKGISTTASDKNISYTSYDMYIYIKDFKYRVVVDNFAFKPDGNFDPMPAEYPLLTKMDASIENIELRRPMSETLKKLSGDIFSSLNSSVKSKSKSDF